MNAFTGQNLADKLSKLNSSQQSIETLSHWCIFHRKKARQVVETWEKEFYHAPREQRLPFLYLANDILQNGKKKGTEFVTEFWKVLPNALRDVAEKGEDAARNAAFRLVDIWEDRKVFGTRPQGLREELLGNKPTHAPLKNLDAVPLPVKPKLFAGGYLEKVAAALQVVQDGTKDEETALMKCNLVISRIDNLEKQAQVPTGEENVVLELEKQQNLLSVLIEQLETIEKSRDVLVSHIREILQEQEKKLESLRTSVQIAQAQAEQAANLKHRLLTGSPIGGPSVSPVRENGPEDEIQNGADMDEHQEDVLGHDMLEMRATTALTPPQAAPPPPVLERTPSLEDDGTKVPNPAAAAAAEVAARLAANSSSAAMLTSVLSSLAAQESASLGHSSPLNQQQLHDALLGGGGHIDKRPRLDNSLSMGDGMGLSLVDGGSQSGSFMQHQQSMNSQSGHQNSSGAGLQQLQPQQQQQPQQQPPLPPSSQHQQSQLHKQMPGPPPIPQYIHGSQGQVQISPPVPLPPNQYSYAGGPGLSVMQAGPHGGMMQSVSGAPRLQPPHPPNSYQPLQAPGGMVGFYSPPPIPAPPAPVPRQ